MKRTIVAIVCGGLMGALGARFWPRTSVPSKAPIADRMPRVSTERGSDISLLKSSVKSTAVRQRNLSPIQLQYDPVALMAEDGVQPSEVFHTEPRDDVFAPKFETRLNKTLTQIFQKLQIENKVLATKVECHTLSCYVVIEVPNVDGEAVYRLLNNIPLGIVQQPNLEKDEDPSRLDITLYEAYSPSMRDDNEFAKQLELNTWRVLEINKRRFAVGSGDAPH